MLTAPTVCDKLTNAPVHPLTLYQGHHNHVCIKGSTQQLNVGKEILWKEAVTAYSKALSQHFGQLSQFHEHSYRLNHNINLDTLKELKPQHVLHKISKYKTNCI
jgi:hypothetical protein